MRKHHSLLLLSALCLASCAKQTYAGKYSFLLGRQGEARIGASVNLSDEDFTYYQNVDLAGFFMTHDEIETYDTSKLQGGEYFLVLDDYPAHEGKYYYIFNVNTNQIVEYGSEKPEPISMKKGKKFNIEIAFGDVEQKLPEYLQNILKEGVNGYYELTNHKHELGQRLSIGTITKKEYIPGLQVFYNYIKEELGEEIADLIETLIEESDLQIPPELIEQLVVAYCDGKALTLQLPVSLDDFILQLAWYGTFIYIDPTMKMAIRSMSDLYKNIFDLILTTNIYDLRTHQEKYLREGESEYRAISLPGDESIQGENRIGSHPGTRYGTTLSRDEKEKLMAEDIAYMNYHYANEFSTTFVTEHDSYLTVNGVITSSSIKDDNGEDITKYYYYDRSGTISETAEQVTGYLALLNNYGVYDDYHKVEINFNGKKDYELGLEISSVIDQETGEEIDPYLYYEQPFTFRDQHDIRIGLQRE